MRRALCLVLLLGSAAACDRAPPVQTEAAVASAAARLRGLDQETRLRLAEVATTRLDVEMAGSLLAGTSGARALVAKARLSLYSSDCEGALAHLSGQAVDGVPGAAELRNVASACHGATAGGVIHEDRERGVWIRLQDDADRVLVPLLLPVIERARTAIGAELGVDLPRPLRLDLVRDLFSLAAVSGLPVEAAETTGTVAVARWGKVTMLSPRATTGGYPWADTLAHELTHLMLTRASVDRAPLWLQEGVAKTLEERWRERRPFDGEPDPNVVALDAAENGQAVGVTKLGPSIAMLPSANAARIAFAEVSSFMTYWMQKNGPRALPLLLRDLAVAKDADSAMRSVSGLGVHDWELLWRDDLRQQLGSERALSAPKAEADLMTAPEIARTLRVSELLYDAGHMEVSSDRARAELDYAPHVAALRYAAARGVPSLERRAEALGELTDVDEPFAEWLALRAAVMRAEQSTPAAEALLEQALSLNPLRPDVACAGGRAGDGAAPELPPELRALCDHVRARPSRTAR